MRIKKVAIRNFRRLENVEIDFEETETVFVGSNNSGKTSAMVAKADACNWQTLSDARVFSMRLTYWRITCCRLRAVFRASLHICRLFPGCAYSVSS
ncbi:ATP-binding protein [Rhodovulum sulfidophilum]|uniref:AAA family ATPase n=1 Tax=Rhodovulum sulfidophilum TaxID=35806 RepID=UPI0019207097|nr:AAA family ATPase [Rhodovulum sulfidophilum]MBL3574951.1 AAA family ATPase [Rhodovulum sulfidophilum]MCE8430768.1 ATP-binding protein [Rhodovulum sulfidophilum]MCF4116918.1 ATP-binding protein [Rhodovulum sulfidophilum]